MKIYVASSWRNEARQQYVVRALREKGHEVYDFRNPEPGDYGFSWRQVAEPDELVNPSKFREVLSRERCQDGFNKDMTALCEADATVLVLPCGRSAHLELGYAVGDGKHTIVLLDDPISEPELMYLMCSAICVSVAEVVAKLADLARRFAMRIYIATGFAKAKALAIPAAERLEKAGIGITCKWWEPTPCPECGGNGTGPDRIDGDGDVYQSECGTCDGTGLPPWVPETELPIEEQRKTALTDLQGVRDADIVWVMSPGPSRPTEFGVRIDLGAWDGLLGRDGLRARTRQDDRLLGVPEDDFHVALGAAIPR